MTDLHGWARRIAFAPVIVVASMFTLPAPCLGERGGPSPTGEALRSHGHRGKRRHHGDGPVTGIRCITVATRARAWRCSCARSAIATVDSATSAYADAAAVARAVRDGELAQMPTFRVPARLRPVVLLQDRPRGASTRRSSSPASPS